MDVAYRIKYYKQAIEDAKRLQREDPKAFKKLLKLESELKEHPRTGTGKPEPVPYTRPGEWSRRCSRRDRYLGMTAAIPQVPVPTASTASIAVTMRQFWGRFRLFVANRLPCRI